MASKLLIDKADRVFSQYIRIRDGFVCVICGSRKNLQNGHYFSRGNMSTRYDPINCACQCEDCNQYHEVDQNPFKRYLIATYGEAEFNALEERHYQIKKYYDWELEPLIDHFKKLIAALSSAL